MGAALALFGTAVAWLGSPEVLKRKMLSGPSSWKKSTTPCRRPVSSDATVTTVVMPMTMPRMVSSERKRWRPHRAAAPCCMFCAGLMFMSYSARSATTGSSLAARDAGYQPETTPTMLETHDATAPRSPSVMCRERSKILPSSTVTSGAQQPRPERRPRIASTTASIRICIMTSPWRAPSDFADADFARALGHAHQHDVHDHDAAHHQRDAGHRHHDRRDHAQQLIDEAADGVGREGVEIVRLRRGARGSGCAATTRVTSSASCIEIQAAARLGAAEQREAVAGAVHAVEGR